MNAAVNELETKARQAKESTSAMAFVPTSVKDAALRRVASVLRESKASILEANRADYEEARLSGMNDAMLDRLLLTDERIDGIAADVLTIAALRDPVGQAFDSRTLPNGIQLSKRRVPLGVIAAIYESRPNVTIDISALCLKSGNACVLRGGKEARRSNHVLAQIMSDACEAEGVPTGAIQFIESTDRSLVSELLQMKQYIDLVIPRGGADLIRLVRDRAAMAVVAGGIGVCHAYVDATADIEMALRIVDNGRVQRPTVCNATDCVLVNRQIAGVFLARLADVWAKSGVEMRMDADGMALLKGHAGAKLVAAVESDWGKEFLSLVAAVKVVDSIGEAVEHIRRYGSGHSEVIITESYSAANRFVAEVDAACVYVNASTRFTDGAQFGLGAEIGISTQKFHARGPMALEEITSYKWVALGTGQIRQ
ncbi:MAG: glutamate-5-semialdehyde dehydrogenase [Dehalococcoidia bacterium]|nr:glutamate-5-semialdehyde dehydrogenase [Dehalococcoidia bacterium]